MNTADHGRWLITTTFELKTPLHLGNGQDEPETRDGEETWIAGITLDHAGKPAIPGASLKGALRALAQRHDQLDALQALFGAFKSDQTSAGLAEFRTAVSPEVVKEASRPHVAINRVSGTAMDKKLFQTRLVPAGTRFHSQIVLHRASQAQLESLLALLQLSGQDASFSLGAHASQGLGVLQLFGQPKVQRFGLAEAKQWLANGAGEHWEKHAQPVTLDTAPSRPQASRQLPPERPTHLPRLALQLAFHSPFLVKGGVEQHNGHDVTVPLRQGQQVILPASSLRGRLRSQAERILRTLGQAVPQGHDAQPWRPGQAHSDLAALLFGSAGWRAIVAASDCIDLKKSPLVSQELLAIDRFTGGGKEGAKFSIQAAECPTLAGQLQLDLPRLKKTGPACWPALGLLSLLLRDLAEGDIPFGYGIAKGYGQCSEKNLLATWETLLRAHFPEQADPVANALAALRTLLPAPPPSSEALHVKPLAPADFKPTPASSGFLNPYHFIPLAKPDTSTWTTPEQLQNERGHHRYHGRSGRISCQLTTQTPLFIGAHRSSEGSTNTAAQLAAYEFQGKPAIPATSLRGMISSLFESISNSGFRVLHPQAYSLRKTARHLSAMGRILIHGEDKKKYLKPLTLPTLNQSESGRHYLIPEKWRKIPLFNGRQVPLRVYFDAPPGEYQAAQSYYMRLEPVIANDGQLATSALLRHPKGGTNTKFVIGQCADGQKPINKAAWESKPAPEQAKYTKGWVRTLETKERRKGNLLPNTVKHLAFLPDLPGHTRAFSLNDSEQRFNELADMAVELMHINHGDTVPDATLLPYVPCGRKREGDRTPSTTPPHATRLQHGDLVFFDIDDNGKVSEISFSSMWRTAIKKPDGKSLATTADLLAQYDPNLLPLGMGQREPRFSPADLLFGAVEYRQPAPPTAPPASASKQALALAGRVLISIGQADTASVQRLPAITLKELSSPKPPSPALYFRPLGNDAYVSKAQLDEHSNTYTLRGRKTYLHAWRDPQGTVQKLNDQGQPDNQRGRAPWASKHHDQPDDGHKRRVKVEPIAAGQTFTFHIDFHNLSDTELQQLCASLQPDPSFEHRLGMGKPLGLGSLKLQITTLQLVDRQNRYASDALTAARTRQSLSADDIAHLTRAGMAAAPPDVRRALQLLGNPAAVAAPVHYPQLKDGTLESEQFKWFMTNDDSSNNATPGNHQSLKAITAKTDRLSPLTRLEGKRKNPAAPRPGGQANSRGAMGKR